MLSLSMVSMVHVFRSSGNYLQDYCFAAQHFEAYCTKKLVLLTSLLLIFPIMSVLLPVILQSVRHSAKNSSDTS
jgi:hypothetical protein